MYEIDSEEIIKAQNNDEEAMTKIIKTNYKKYDIIFLYKERK